MSIEEFLKSYKEEALEKSKVVKQTKVTSFFTVVEQNAEKPGPSGQKFSKPPLKELDGPLNCCLMKTKSISYQKIELICFKWCNKTRI